MAGESCAMRTREIGTNETHQINTNRIIKSDCVCGICDACVDPHTWDKTFFFFWLLDFFCVGFFSVVFAFVDARCSGSAVCLKQRVRDNLWFALFSPHSAVIERERETRARFIFSNFPKGRTRYHSVISLCPFQSPPQPHSVVLCTADQCARKFYSMCECVSGHSVNTLCAMLCSDFYRMLWYIAIAFPA